MKHRSEGGYSTYYALTMPQDFKMHSKEKLIQHNRGYEAPRWPCQTPRIPKKQPFGRFPLPPILGEKNICQVFKNYTTGHFMGVHGISVIIRCRPSYEQYPAQSVNGMPNAAHTALQAIK